MPNGKSDTISKTVERYIRVEGTVSVELTDKLSSEAFDDLASSGLLVFTYDDIKSYIQALEGGATHKEALDALRVDMEIRRSRCE